MSIFKVTIRKTLEKTVDVEADNGFDAVDMVREEYHAGQWIIEDDDDLKSLDFTVNGPLVRD